MDDNICKNCIHQKACEFSLAGGVSFWVDKTDIHIFESSAYVCSFFEDKEKYQVALEKQIPKKPLRGYTCKANNDSWRSCPVCHARQWNTHKYCSQCGQALDWSE